MLLGASHITQHINRTTSKIAEIMYCITKSICPSLLFFPKSAIPHNNIFHPVTALQKFKFLNMKLKSQTTSMFSSSSNQDCVTTQLDHYLADIRKNDTRNPLGFWKERQAFYSKITPIAALGSFVSSSLTGLCGNNFVCI